MRELYNDDNKTNKNKLRTYRELKSEYVLENFLLLDIQKILYLTLSNYRLVIVIF